MGQTNHFEMSVSLHIPDGAAAKTLAITDTWRNAIASDLDALKHANPDTISTMFNRYAISPKTEAPADELSALLRRVYLVRPHHLHVTVSRIGVTAKNGAELTAITEDICKALDHLRFAGGQPETLEFNRVALRKKHKDAPPTALWALATRNTNQWIECLSNAIDRRLRPLPLTSLAARANGPDFPAHATIARAPGKLLNILHGLQDAMEAHPITFLPAMLVLSRAIPNPKIGKMKVHPDFKHIVGWNAVGQRIHKDLHGHLNPPSLMAAAR